MRAHRSRTYREHSSATRKSPAVWRGPSSNMWLVRPAGAGEEEGSSLLAEAAGEKIRRNPGRRP